MCVRKDLRNAGQTNKKRLPAGTLIFIFLFTFLSFTYAERPGEKWIKTFKLAPGLKAELFADEDQLINPVAINFDLQNRLYVCESLRQGKGVTGAARKKFLAKDDFLIKSFEDRLALHNKYDSKLPIDSMIKVSEQLRVLIDKNRDGIADSSEVIADNFKDLLSGAAAGVTIRDGYAYFTCIPGLYRIDLKTGKTETLAEGFGIRIGVHGHDLHAPVWGMDGKLYFNIGDRGFDVKTKEGKRLYGPLKGGVFRCNPDGSELELYHEGVRNPQGMAFDEFGNLFTVDNDMGAGDKCRVLFLGEGGDSGWSACNQIFRTYRIEMGMSGHAVLPPWMSENLWKTAESDQPAWINPAAGHLTNGPSGMEYYPGAGFDSKYKNHFFICDHRGNAARSRTFAFKLEDSGAGFKMVSQEIVIANLLASDVSFGYDGKLYFSDWIGGGNGTGTGRIYALTGKDTNNASYPAKQLHEYTSEELIKLLEHPDKRIRLFTQFELAKRKESQLLLKLLKSSKNLLAKLHCIWGLGQIGNSNDLMKIIDLLKDQNPHIRAQTAKVLGENNVTEAAVKIAQLINDENSKVRYHSLISLGKFKFEKALSPVTEMLASLKQKDPILRQAASLYLSSINRSSVANLINHKSVEVRLNAVLSLRKLNAPEISQFLLDENPLVLNEVIAAIYDRNIKSALSGLADFINSPKFSSISSYNQIRVINANYKLGNEKHLEKVLKLVKNKADKSVYLETLNVILNWQDEALLDRVLWTPVNRSSKPVPGTQKLVYSTLKSMMDANSIPDEFKETCLKILDKYSPELSMAEMKKRVLDNNERTQLRTELFQKLSAQKTDLDSTFLKELIKDEKSPLFKEAFKQLVTQFPKEAESLIIQFFGQENFFRKPFLLEMCQKLESPQIDSLLIKEMTFSKTYSFELIEAIKNSKNSELKILYNQYLKQQDDEKLGPYIHTLHGGDPQAGKFIFNNSAAQCIRCHKAGKEGGEVGPDLSTIGSQKDLTYILESLVNPSAKITPGFGTVVVTHKNGSVTAGILQSEDKGNIKIKDLNGKVISIPLNDIKEKTTPISSMPPMANLLTPKELRDLIAYLGSLK